MSNLSLQEQLKALSSQLSPAPSAERHHHATKDGQEKPSKAQQNKHKDRQNIQAAQTKPAWLDYVKYGVEILKAYFPECFKEGSDVQPLKIGIKHDLVKALSTLEAVTIVDKACAVASLSYYVQLPSYHKVVVVGAQRVDLFGHSAGEVTAEEAEYSRSCIEAKRHKKMKRDGVNQKANA